MALIKRKKCRHCRRLFLPAVRNHRNTHPMLVIRTGRGIAANLPARKPVKSQSESYWWPGPSIEMVCSGVARRLRWSQPSASYSARYCVGQHDDLKKRVIVLEPGRGNGVQAFPLGLADQVLHIRAFIIFGNHDVSRSGQVGTENTVRIWIIKKLQLHRTALTRLHLPRYPHGNKTAGSLPPNGLIHITVKLDVTSPVRTIPAARIKGRIAPLVADDKLKTALHCGGHALPTEELPIGPQQHFLHTTGKMLLDLADKNSGLLPGNRLPLTQLAEQI